MKTTPQLRLLFLTCLVFSALPAACAQTPIPCNCTWDLPTQMGSGGGIFMYFLGIFTALVLGGVAYLLSRQRWFSMPATPHMPNWHLPGFPKANPSPYAPVPDPQDPTAAASQMLAGAQWPPPASQGWYQTEYQVIAPDYRL